MEIRRLFHPPPPTRRRCTSIAPGADDELSCDSAAALPLLIAGAVARLAPPLLLFANRLDHHRLEETAKLKSTD
jgi:hypothetical protein